MFKWCFPEFGISFSFRGETFWNFRSITGIANNISDSDMSKIDHINQPPCSFKKQSSTYPTYHQTFQVPKMEVPKLIRLFFGVSFPLHKAYPYSKNIGLRTSIWMVPKMLVNLPQIMLLPKFLQTRSKIEGGRYFCRFVCGKIWRGWRFVGERFQWRFSNFCFRVYVLWKTIPKTWRFGLDSIFVESFRGWF